MEYEFLFVVEGATVDDSETVELLYERLDAMLFRGGGVDLLDVPAEGPNAFTAAMNAARAVKDLVPAIRLLRLDRELVGVPEIAGRTEATRQNVHQWVRGERHGNVPFPAPEGTVGRAQVWLWSEVNAWLERIGKGDGVNRPGRYEMARIDTALQQRLRSETEASRSVRSLSRIPGDGSTVDVSWAGEFATGLVRSGETEVEPNREPHWGFATSVGEPASPEAGIFSPAAEPSAADENTSTAVSELVLGGGR